MGRLSLDQLLERWNRRWGIDRTSTGRVPVSAWSDATTIALCPREACRGRLWDCRVSGKCQATGHPLGASGHSPADVDIPTHMKPEETAALVELARGRYVLEVGSWLGHSTVAMAKVAERVWAVDWHRSDAQLAATVGGTFDSARLFLDNIDRAGVRDRVVVVIGRSEEVLPRLAFNPEGETAAFGLAFLDGAHDADQVEADARNALRALGPVLGGRQVLAAHDWGLFGVAEGLRRAGFREPDRVVGSLAVFEF